MACRRAGCGRVGGSGPISCQLRPSLVFHVTAVSPFSHSFSSRLEQWFRHQTHLALDPTNLAVFRHTTACLYNSLLTQQMERIMLPPPPRHYCKNELKLFTKLLRQCLTQSTCPISTPMHTERLYYHHCVWVLYFPLELTFLVIIFVQQMSAPLSSINCLSLNSYPAI